MRVRLYALFLLIPVLVASCAKDVDTTAAPRALPIIKEASSAAKASDKVSETSGKANAQSAVTASKVEAVKKESANLRSDLGAALKETQRLKTQKTATEAELDALLTLLKKADTRNLTLEQEIDAAAISIAREKELRIMANDALLEMQQVAREKDQEAELLRNNLTISQTDTSALRTANEALGKQAAQADAKLQHSMGATSVWRKIAFGIGILFILSLLANYLQLKRIL